jgi:outer membrane protein assembly factor BamB
MKRTLLITTVLMLLASPVAAEEDWSTFRGDARLTGVAGSSLPDDMKVIWTAEIGEGIESTAAIVNDVVYVGGLDGHLYALDFSTGKELWRYQAGDEIKSSPSVRDGVVYVGDESGLFHAVGVEDGKKHWTFAADAGVISSASFAGGGVIFGSQDNFLYCLKPSDGSLRWKVETGSFVYATAAIAEIDGKQAALVAGCDGLLRAIDVKDGNQIAEVEIDAYVGASPVVGNGRAYFGTFENNVLAVDLAAGEVVWRYTNTERQFPYYSSAAYTEKLLVIGGRDKLVHALNPATGEAVWTWSAGARVDSSPVIAGEVAWLGTGAGDVVGLAIQDGSKVWSYATGSSITASAAVARGRLVIGTLDGMLYCFGAPDEVAEENKDG